MAVKKPISLTDFSVSFVSVFRGRRSARFLLFPRTIDAGTAMKLELYLFFLSFLAPGLTSFFFLPRTSSFFDVSIVAVCAPVDGFQRRLRNLHSSRAVFLSLSLPVFLARSSWFLVNVCKRIHGSRHKRERERERERERKKERERETWHARRGDAR